MKHLLSGLAFICGLACAGASATTRDVTPYAYKLSRQQIRQLETAACLRPFRLQLQAAYGLTYDKEGTDLQARVLCRTHVYITTQPVSFQVTCNSQHDVGWTCSDPSEVMDARFPDGHLLVTAEQVSLEEAHLILAKLAASGAFSPGRFFKRAEPLGRTKGSWEQCDVSEYDEADNFRIDCQSFDGQVKREVSPNGLCYVLHYLLPGITETPLGCRLPCELN